MEIRNKIIAKIDLPEIVKCKIPVAFCSKKCDVLFKYDKNPINKDKNNKIKPILIAIKYFFRLFVKKNSFFNLSIKSRFSFSSFYFSSYRTTTPNNC